MDLAGLAGTGPGGSISRDDVQQASAQSNAAVPAPQIQAGPPEPREERIAIRGVRKHTAAAVAESARRAPHVTEFLQVDVGATVDAVGRLRELPEFTGVRVSPLLLVARALLVAVARHPMINSSWDEDAQEIVVKHYVNLGIAAATERGLIVPNIKGADTLSLPALAQALGGLAATARAGTGVTGGPVRRDDHHHQRRGVRGGRGYPDHHPAGSGHPGLRADQGRAVGGGRPAGGAQGDDPVAVVRPSHRGRRPGVSRTPRYRGHAARPDHHAGLGLATEG